MGGGEGNFRAAGIFFRYQIPCMNFFQAPAWIFLKVNWRAPIFFKLNFPLREFFFCTSPAPPHKFSNGPSLRASFHPYPNFFCHWCRYWKKGLSVHLKNAGSFFTEFNTEESVTALDWGHIYGILVQKHLVIISCFITNKLKIVGPKCK